jgi:ubiquinone/menaquinone biosynthesis C-methylase UbiE
MAGIHSAELYETPELQAVTGPALRPGGVELTRRAVSLCTLPAGSPVVDIGCGTGVTLRFLRQQCRFKAVGLDASPAMLTQTRQRFSDMPLMQGTASCLPFPTARLSAVVCECVLSLVADIDGTWQEFHRVLVPGGYLVVADIYLRASEQARRLDSAGVTGCLRGARTRRELINRLNQSGFTLISWEDHSEHLKRLVAQLVFAGVSFSVPGGNGSRSSVTKNRNALRRARPGYFLMVARKRGR